MKRLSVLAFFTIICLMACDENEVNPDKDNDENTDFLTGSWFLSNVSVLDHSTDFEISFFTNKVYVARDIISFVDNNLNNSEILSTDGYYALSIENEELTFHPGGTGLFKIVSDEEFTFAYYAPYPNITDNEAEIILTFTRN